VTALRKLSQLSKREVWVLARAAVLLPAVRLALHFITVSRLKDFGSLANHDPRFPELPPQATARLVRIAAQRGLCRSKCLDKSLVLRWLLRRQGIDARIVFGARKEDEQMEIHAWVEVDGVAIGEDDGVNHHFSPLEELNPSISN
jgi:hypothetical protein